MKLKQSVCLPMVLPEAEWNSGLFERLKETGFSAVELWDRDVRGEFKGLFSKILESGLSIATIVGHGSIADGMNNVNNHERIEAELKESIDVAAEFRIPGLICYSGNRIEGRSDIEGLRNCVKLMKKIAPYAESANVNLNMELLNSKYDHPGYQCDSTEFGLAVCELSGSPNVKLLYDIYHMQIMEGDIIRSVTRNIEYIGHFHTAGVPGRSNPDASQEINYPAVASAIKAVEYRYFLGHEYRSVDEPLESLKKNFRIFDV